MFSIHSCPTDIKVQKKKKIPFRKREKLFTLTKQDIIWDVGLNLVPFETPLCQPYAFLSVLKLHAS